MVLAGRPVTVAVQATAAITAARITDGSHPVSRPKKARITIVAAQRADSRSRRRSGPNNTRTKATFSPDTAKRWLKPLSRKRASRAGDRAVSSPRITPSRRLRSSVSRGRAPRTSVRRTRAAARLAGEPGRTRPTVETSRRPAMWRGSNARRETGPRGPDPPAQLHLLAGGDGSQP